MRHIYLLYLALYYTQKKQAEPPKMVKYVKEFGIFTVVCLLVYLVGYFRWSFFLVLIPIIMYVVRSRQKAEKKERVTVAYSVNLLTNLY